MVWRRHRSQRIPNKMTIQLNELACLSSMDTCRRHEIPRLRQSTSILTAKAANCPPLFCSLWHQIACIASKKVIWLFRYLVSSSLWFVLCRPSPKIDFKTNLLKQQFLRNDCFPWAYKAIVEWTTPYFKKHSYVIQ